MKRKFEIHTSEMICVICVLVSFLQIGCQEQFKLTEKSFPEIKFDKLVHDFGEVGPNTKNIGEFKFTNVGEGQLNITKVGRCCGVVTRLDKMEYKPGESGILQVEWNSGPRESTFTRKLTVYSNDPNNPATALTVKAKVVLQIDWEPKRLKLFLDEENAGCPNITIKSVDNRPFSITGFNSTADCITADYDPSEKATEFVLEPKVDMEMLQQNHKGRINISLDHPNGNEAIVLFSVLPKYTVNPPLIIIFNAEPEKPIMRTVSVLNNYHKDFEIESLSSENDLVSIKILEKKKISNGYQLEVEITPSVGEGKMRFTDLLSLNIKDGEKLSIRCNGYYEKRKTKAETQQDEQEKPE